MPTMAHPQAGAPVAVVVPVEPNHVPDDLICSICFGVPSLPVIVTHCQHLFCQPCLDQALNASSLCPICRKTCTSQDVKPLTKGSLVYRIWSGIPVKCGKHEEGCAWTGTIADAQQHAQKCAHNKAGRAHEAQIKRLEQRNKGLIEEVMELETLLDEKERFLERALFDREHFEERCNELEAEKEEKDQKFSKLQADKEEKNRLLETERSKRASLEAKLKKVLAHPNLRLEVLFDGNYTYNRNNVVKLSQLISRYLECKPAEIDPNRIFNCVRNCYQDLQKNWKDNPPHYTMDMRMLLTTCAASTWFTNNQRNNILNWLEAREWD